MGIRLRDHHSPQRSRLDVTGSVGGVEGVFRSDDAGWTWGRVNDDAHDFYFINAITSDPRVYGRVYLATGGRGIIVGDIKRP